MRNRQSGSLEKAVRLGRQLIRQFGNRQSGSVEKAVRPGRPLIRQSGSLAVLQSGRPPWPGGGGLPEGRLFLFFGVFDCFELFSSPVGSVHKKNLSVGSHKYRPHKQIVLVYTENPALLWDLYTRRICLWGSTNTGPTN